MHYTLDEYPVIHSQSKAAPHNSQHFLGRHHFNLTPTKLDKEGLPIYAREFGRGYNKSPNSMFWSKSSLGFLGSGRMLTSPEFMSVSPCSFLLFFLDEDNRDLHAGPNIRAMGNLVLATFDGKIQPINPGESYSLNPDSTLEIVKDKFNYGPLNFLAR